MSTVRKLTAVLDLDTGKFTVGVRRASQEMRYFQGRLDGLNSSSRNFERRMGRQNSTLRTASQQMRDFTIMLGQARTAMILLSAISVGWIGSAVKMTSQVEKLTVLMRSLSTEATELGKQRDAEKNLQNLYAMSEKTGFSINALADTYVKFRTASIDPMAGSMQALADAVAASGKGEAELHRASIAIQQMAGKGVISMEELRQQLGEAVPFAFNAMAEAAGVSMAKLAKLVESGTVEAGPAMQLMFDEFARRYSGMSYEMSNTFDGLINRLKTQMTRLATEFTGFGNNSSMFDNIKSSMESLIEALGSEEVLRFAHDLGGTISTIIDFVGRAIGLFAEWKGVISTVATALMAMWGARFVSGFVLQVNNVADAFNRSRESHKHYMRQLATAFPMYKKEMDYNKALVKGEETRIKKLNDGSIAKREAAKAALENAKIDAENSRRIVEQSKIDIAASSARLESIKRRRAELDRERETMVRWRAAMANGTLAQEKMTMTVRSSSEILAERRRLHAMAIDAERQHATATQMLAHHQKELAGSTARISEANKAYIVASEKASRRTALYTSRVEMAQQKTRMFARAMQFAAMAGRTLRASLNLLFGPIGMVITILGSIAWEMGLFKSETEKTAEAVERLNAGLADQAEIMNTRKMIKDKEARIDKLKKEVETGKSSDPTVVGGMVIYKPLNEEEIKKRQEEIEQREKEIISLNQGILTNSAVRIERYVNQFYAQATRGYEREVRKISQEHNSERAKIEKMDLDQLERQKKLDENQARTDKRIADLRIKYYEEFIKNKVNYNTPHLDEQQRKEVIDQVETMLKSQADESLANVLSARGRKEVGLVLFENTDAEAEKLAKMEARRQVNQYTSTLREMMRVRARVLGENEDAADWEGHKLGKAQTKVSEEMIADVIKQKEYWEEIESFLKSANIDVNRMTRLMERAEEEAASLSETYEALGDITVGTTASAEAAFAKLEGRYTKQTFRVKRMVDELKTQLQNANVSGDVRKEFDKMIENIEQGYDEFERRILQNRDLDMSTRAKAGIQDMMNDVYTKHQGMFTYQGDEVTKIDYQLQQLDVYEAKLIETGKITQAEIEALGVMRDMLDQQRTVASLGTFGKNLLDWQHGLENIRELGGTALDGFTEALMKGGEGMKRFGKTMVQQLTMIIVRAMLARAILSALGLTSYSAGLPKQGASFGNVSAGVRVPGLDFSGLGNVSLPAIEAHTGGIVGALTPKRLMSADMLAAASRYHTGKSPRLKSGEVPAILKEDEGVFTKEQMAALGRGARSAPNVSVNLINESGTALEGVESGARFDGEKYVVDILLSNLHKPGPVRDALKGFK